MHRIALVILLLVALVPFSDARARSRSSTGSRTRPTRTTASRSTHMTRSHSVKTPRFAPHSSARCASCTRNSRGRISRSSTAKHDFQKSHPCPSTGRTTGACPGYVIDHVVPLKRVGADALGNMQWQTRAAAKAKDKIE
jgi:hypothetical protein